MVARSKKESNPDLYCSLVLLCELEAALGIPGLRKNALLVDDIKVIFSKATKRQKKAYRKIVWEFVNHHAGPYSDFSRPGGPLAIWIEGFEPDAVEILKTLAFYMGNHDFSNASFIHNKIKRVVAFLIRSRCSLYFSKLLMTAGQRTLDLDFQEPQ